MIYLDHNATSPLRPAARAAWLAVQETAWANPAARHRAGQQARYQLDQARARVARAIAVRGEELVFTSGGSEALAQAIHGAAVRGLVASAVDHSAVLRNCATRTDLPTRILGVDALGRLDAAELQRMLGSEPQLVCLQAANNETGVCQDLPSLITAVRAAGPGHLILIDACQWLGKAPLQVPALGADLLAFSGHKFGAPKGCGGLWIRPGLELPALIHGGRQQQDRRSGTEDVAAAAAMAAALEEALTEDRQPLDALCTELVDGLTAVLPQLRWLGRSAARLPGVLCLVHPGIDGAALATRLDLAGIAVSTGSACMAARGAPSHVVQALCGDADLARSAIRVSAAVTTTRADLLAFAQAYQREIGG